MSRRDHIAMTAAEIAAFLDEQRVVVCATNGPRGWPHLMPLWYLVRSGDVWAWTYAKSQKVRNLERDPRATLQIEDGEGYEELRGVMVEARTEIHRDVEVVTELGVELLGRYTGAAGDELLEGVRRQAGKRVAMQFVPERMASWDHRKLGARY
ncbi:MAG TPA: pyridoxamine 5'-phosphate oxidase family protein [Solirubrobacteraceae bacterium]|nr:pyridoxamine 5'-phosphate oxidase family protein [Solirubrobacteraceae bacterium]